jgi:hypothetical protein
MRRWSYGNGRKKGASAMVWVDWRRKRHDAGERLCGGGSYGEHYTRMCPSISFAEYAHNRPVIDGIVRKIEKVPLLNIAGGIINDYQYLWENYYFPSNSYDTLLTLAASI